jgi:ankyrin repeat protein
MKELFDPMKSHLAVWLWIDNPIWPYGQGETPTPPRRSALHYAAFCGLPIVVKFLFIEHSQNMHSLDFHDYPSPLHLVARQGHVEVASVLVEHGADVSAKGQDGDTPLHHALDGGHIDVTKFIIEHGADVLAKNKFRWTLLHQALSCIGKPAINFFSLYELVQAQKGAKVAKNS